MKTYLQHGSAAYPPMRTEEVPNKTTRIPQASLCGAYGGGGQATSIKVLFEGSWRRVYAYWSSSLYINYDGVQIKVTTEVAQ